MMRWMQCSLLVIIFLGGHVEGAYADSYPSKSIRVLAPFSPGGVLGADFAAMAPADGYALFLGGVGSLVVNPQVMTKISYDPLKDFSPIIQFATTPSVVAINCASQFKTIQELTSYAKQYTECLNYASNEICSHWKINKVWPASGELVVIFYALNLKLNHNVYYFIQT